MTTTRDALARGSGRFVRVVAIEGIGALPSEAPEADVQAAWASTDWNGKPVYSAFIEVNNKQTANPWEPFQAGGSATITVLDDAFGVLTHRTAGGAETELTVTMDRNDQTVNVKDTSQFPATGEVHVGTECIEYFTTTAKSFGTGDCYRGKYSPFLNGNTGESQRNYSHDHRVGAVNYGPNLMPKVTQYPRQWVGRWVGVWLHTYDENGINSKADALCIFAGHIADVHDDPKTGGTVVVCEHAQTALKEVTSGRDVFTASVADGVQLVAGMQFGMRDYDGAGEGNALSLNVVATGASGAYEVNEGHYTGPELLNAINAWLSDATATGVNINGSYTLGYQRMPDGSTKIRISWFIAGSGTVWFNLFTPPAVAYFWGFADPPTTTSAQATIAGNGPHDTQNALLGQNAPLRSFVGAGQSIVVESANGVFRDQYDWLPSNLKPASDGGKEWGLFLFDGKGMLLASFEENGDDTFTLSDILPLNIDVAESLTKSIDDQSFTPIRQVFLYEMPWSDWVKRFIFSTGTATWNHADWDVLPYGIGLGWPGELFGILFETSVDNTIDSGLAASVLIDKPIKITSLLGGDLVFRHAFPVWKSGGFLLNTWQTPSTDLAVADLTEANKAEPVGNKISQRSATVLTDQWAKPVIKIRYNRLLTGNGDDYRDVINIEDRTAVDDSGTQGDPFTIDARNTFAEFADPNAGIALLVPDAFLPPITMFTRASHRLTRSVALPLFENYAPGDIVNVTDSFARDPVTGERGVVTRPATIISHSYSLGGLVPGSDKPASMVGEVELMFVDTNRIFAYAPSAQVSSYNSGTKTITLADHAYSESSEAIDATRFGAGYAIRITEIDPADPATALTWTRGIVSRSGSDIVHDGVALASFDAGKEYRVTFDTYSAVTTGQQDKAFQADDDDNLIEDLAQPKMYGSAVSQIAATTSTTADLPELHADVDIGDGKAYDVGSLKGWSRLVENLIDTKTAISSPRIGTTMTNTDYSSLQGFKVVSIEPVFLTTARLTNAVLRFVSLAPWIRSTDGSSVSVRVSLMPKPPTYAGVNDIVRDPPYGDITFTTSSTTWELASPGLLPVHGAKTVQGLAWIVIECGYKSECRGLGYFHEGPRAIV